MQEGARLKRRQKTKKATKINQGENEEKGGGRQSISKGEMKTEVMKEKAANRSKKKAKSGWINNLREKVVIPVSKKKPQAMQSKRNLSLKYSSSLYLKLGAIEIL